MVRAWSAMSRRATSLCSLSPRRRPVTYCAASTSRLTVSAAYSDGLSARTASMRSKPAPVSMFVAAEVAQLPVGTPEVLREHEVPDLDVTLLGRRVGGTAVGAEVGAVVPEDLRAGTARAGVAHLPEVVLVEPLDPVAGEAHRVGPDLLGLVVADVDGDPHAVTVEAELLGEELPSPRDGVGLEVVVEAEVAEHLEEAEVPARPADGVEVVVLAAGPHAALHRRGPRRVEGHRLLTQEVRDELHHPRVREHRRRRVQRDQPGRGDEGVPALLEEGGERPSQLSRVHGRTMLPAGIWAYRRKTPCSGG